MLKRRQLGYAVCRRGYVVLLGYSSQTPTD